MITIIMWFASHPGRKEQRYDGKCKLWADPVHASPRICLSMCLFVCLSDYLSICPSVCPSGHLSVYQAPCYLSVHRSLGLSICFCLFSIYLSASVRLPLFLSVHLYVCVYARMHVCMSVCMCVSICVCLSTSVSFSSYFA